MTKNPDASCSHRSGRCCDGRSYPRYGCAASRITASASSASTRLRASPWFCSHHRSSSRRSRSALGLNRIDQGLASLDALAPERRERFVSTDPSATLRLAPRLGQETLVLGVDEPDLARDGHDLDVDLGAVGKIDVADHDLASAYLRLMRHHASRVAEASRRHQPRSRSRATACARMQQRAGHEQLSEITTARVRNARRSAPASRTPDADLQHRHRASPANIERADLRVTLIRCAHDTRGYSPDCLPAPRQVRRRSPPRRRRSRSSRSLPLRRCRHRRRRRRLPRPRRTSRQRSRSR